MTLAAALIDPGHFFLVRLEGNQRGRHNRGWTATPSSRGVVVRRRGRRSTAVVTVIRGRRRRTSWVVRREAPVALPTVPIPVSIAISVAVIAVIAMAPISVSFSIAAPIAFAISLPASIAVAISIHVSSATPSRRTPFVPVGIPVRVSSSSSSSSSSEVPAVWGRRPLPSSSWSGRLLVRHPGRSVADPAASPPVAAEAHSGPSSPIIYSVVCPALEQQ